MVRVAPSGDARTTFCFLGSKSFDFNLLRLLMSVGDRGLPESLGGLSRWRRQALVVDLIGLTTIFVGLGKTG